MKLLLDENTSYRILKDPLLTREQILDRLVGHHLSTEDGPGAWHQ